MTTYGRSLLSELADARAELVKLTHVSYEPSEIREAISAVGAKTEIFLKSVVLPGRNSRNTLQWFIDELAGSSISASSRDKLHSLRQTCNDAKHEPTIIIPLLDAIRIVNDAQEAIEEIVTQGIGSVAGIVHPHTHRVFWIAVWDHFAQGDSEVHVIIPGESEHWLGPPTFDIVYVSISGWNDVVATLPRVGVFSSGKGLVPESQYDAFNSDEDFLGAWVFEGDYRSLITTLAQHELRQELIPGLNRHDSSGSMILAFLLASIDVASDATNPIELPAAIIAQATGAYAVPPDYKYAQPLAEGMSEMMRQIAVADWSTISGPIWMRESEFDALAAQCRAKHPKYDIIIDATLSVRMLVEVRKVEQAKREAEAEKQFELQLEKLREKLAKNADQSAVLHCHERGRS
jgi:hypothetical protein